jgi:predicted nucleotidyltransferase component of viral defense system
MSKEQIKNLSASVRDRLLNLSRERREDFQFILTRYANERFLYRLYRSKHSEKFVLKGAMLLMAWTQDRYRPTRDIDLLVFGDNSEETLMNIFQEICRIDVEADGLTFDAENIRIMGIREDHEYHGQRILLNAYIGQATIPLQFDVGFGDTVVPAPLNIDFPTILDFPAPRIKAYPKESVVSEKLQIMVEFGIANSRMKDYYDLYVIAKYFDFEGSILVKAIISTFRRRNTEIPQNTPIALSDDFVTDKSKQQQWSAFIKINNVHQLPESLDEIVSTLSEFLLSPLHAASADSETWHYSWKDGEPWIKSNIKD